MQLPTVYNYKECVETDGQFFWSGAPWVSPLKFRSQTLNPTPNPHPIPKP